MVLSRTVNWYMVTLCSLILRTRFYKKRKRIEMYQQAVCLEGSAFEQDQYIIAA